jgi:NADH-quinone oxidoreductase subunit N
MYFDEPGKVFDDSTFTQRTVLALGALAMLLFWVNPEPLIRAASFAAQSLF